MTKFESGVKTVPASQESVYNILSEPANIEKIRELLPPDKAAAMSFDNDSITLDIPSAGKIKLKCAAFEPHKSIKFNSVDSPLPFTLWIQLLPVETTTCKMRVTIGLDTNPFMLGIVRKPLQEQLDKMADLLAAIPYNSI
ncbi:MAG: SRPBCC family protein [Prevotellaceae bacterium]|jgi:hypothetical protein|nr:SRPBCC family protein [Prevotellaceae bacterium]